MTWPATYVCAPRYSLVDTFGNGARLNEQFSIEPDRVRVHVPLWGVEPWGAAEFEHYSKLGPLIVDAAHLFAHSHHMRGLEKGYIQAVTYSFGPQKEITTWRGGALISPCITPEVRAYANVGTRGRDLMVPAGGNHLMSEPALALLPMQLQRFYGMRAWRQDILRVYETRMRTSMTPITDTIQAGGHLAVNLFASKNAAGTASYILEKANIMTGHHYPLPKLYPAGLFPRASNLSERLLTLPCHLDMGPEDAHHVCDVLEPFGLALPRDRDA